MNVTSTSTHIYKKLQDNLEKVLRGKQQVIEFLIVSLFSGGHVLLEDVPGVGKTTLAKSLSKSIGGEFKRVQFTPDLLPTDILGSSIYNPKEGLFNFKQGPIFTNVLLADEINRASPRTQSSLLEAMNERQVTIEGTSYPLPSPFIVLATQNPVEYHGTYPLPEAQLDRFNMQLSLGYPDPEAELEVLERQRKTHPLDQLEPVITLEELLQIQEQVKDIIVKKPIAQYILKLVQATRNNPQLRLGSSPRGSLALYRTSQALAFCRGRDYVTPDDIKEIAVPVLAHRLVLDTKAKYSGVSKQDIIKQALETIPVEV